MIKLNRFYFILAILLGNLFSNCSPAQKPVQIMKTTNQQQSWSLKFLNENVLSCKRIDDSVAFRTTNKLGIGQWGQSWHQSFVLGRDGGFFLVPDHHMKLNFRIASIDSASVHMKYEYRFDHRSFGKELISIDSGEIRFNFK